MVKKTFLLIFLSIMSFSAVAQTIAESHKPIFISHAFGSIEGCSYTNSYQALFANYSRGQKYFEVDIARTKDEKLVCFHLGEEQRLDPRIKNIEHCEERNFLKSKFDSQFSTMRFLDVLRTMSYRQDIHLVTDTKYWDSKLVYLMIKQLTLVDPSITKRIIIQIYKQSDYQLLKPLLSQIEICGIIYTLYQLDSSYDDVLSFTKSHHIDTIAVEVERWQKRQKTILWLKSFGLNVLVFTVNDKKLADEIFQQGLDGIYTDEL